MTAETPGKGEAQAAAIEACRNEWERVADAWARWEPFFAASTLPVTLKLMAAAGVKRGMRVLDVGGGIGDPSLAIASAVGDEGDVLSLELSPRMVEVARRRARRLGLGNVEFRAAALEDLDPAASPFDAVISRFTINFLYDLPTGLRRLRDFLVPGGRLAAAVWGSPDVNPMFGIPREQLSRFIDTRRQPPRDAPGPLWLSERGKLARALSEAGFASVTSTDVRLYNFATDADTYMRMVYETAPMFRRAFNGLAGDQQRAVREGVIAAVAAYDDGGVIRVPGVARVASGTKRGHEPSSGPDS
jgi:ubiquinone/menaquinone biosynthesis C-methylase UbiE